MNTTITNLASVTGNTNIASTKSKESSATSATEKKESIQSQVRTSMNEQIVQASLRVSLTAGNNPQSLLFQSAMEGIYEAMGGGFKSNIMPEYQMPSATGPDNPYATPEGSANVILDFSLGLYASFKVQHPRMEESEVAAKFIDTIRGGFEEGYAKAVEILDALGVFSGDLKAEIEKTYELVMKGYDDFLTSKTPQPQPEPRVESDSTVS